MQEYKKYLGFLINLSTKIETDVVVVAAAGAVE